MVLFKAQTGDNSSSMHHKTHGFSDIPLDVMPSGLPRAPDSIASFSLSETSSSSAEFMTGGFRSYRRTSILLVI